MRVASVAGVKDINVPTSIYRLWVNAENSQSVHNKNEWLKNHMLVQENIFAAPFVVPSNTQKSLAKEPLWAEYDESSRIPKMAESLLYLNRGNGFNEDDKIKCFTRTTGRAFETDISFEEYDNNGIWEIRFDISEDGLFVMQDVMALLKYQDGSVETLGIDRCQTNGTLSDNSVFFLLSDPWLIWKVNKDKRLKSVRIIGNLNLNITLDIARSACRKYAETSFQLFYRTEETFSEDKSISVNGEAGFIDLTYWLNTDEPITGLRFDPGDKAGCMLCGLKAGLIDKEGNSEYLSLEDYYTNGRCEEGSFIFENDDPQLGWKIENRLVSAVRIRGIFEYMDL